MESQVFLGVVAIGIGMAFGVVLFVPFVAISYRRRGRLTFGRLVLWLSALVYFWAIWTYTLLPLPEPETIRCVGAITDPMSMVRDVQRALEAPGNPLLHPALLQLLFNVLLFVPLGVFVRVLAARGVPTALVVGLGMSLLIELTQLTGVWGLYPCAYRFFDVGDLVTNPLGAVVGSVFALVVPRSRRGTTVLPDADEPRPVTRGRRALAMLCDGLGYAFVTFGVGATVQLGMQFGLSDRRPEVLDGSLAQTVAVITASSAWVLVVLISGRSVGDLAVQLRYSGSRLPTAIARPLRAIAGIGGIGVLSVFGGVFPLVSSALAVLAIVLLFTTREGRGLPGVLSGQKLLDARQPPAPMIRSSAPGEHP